MVYFEVGLVKFPKHFDENEGKLILKNEMTGEIIEIEVEDQSENNHFYLFDIQHDLKNGTYRYNYGKEVGLLQVGDYVSPVNEYNERKTNIVYEG